MGGGVLYIRSHCNTHLLPDNVLQRPDHVTFNNESYPQTYKQSYVT